MAALNESEWPQDLLSWGQSEVTESIALVEKQFAKLALLWRMKKASSAESVIQLPPFASLSELPVLAQAYGLRADVGTQAAGSFIVVTATPRSRIPVVSLSKTIMALKIDDGPKSSQFNQVQKTVKSEKWGRSMLRVERNAEQCSRKLGAEQVHVSWTVTCGEPVGHKEARRRNRYEALNEDGWDRDDECEAPMVPGNEDECCICLEKLLDVRGVERKETLSRLECRHWLHTRCAMTLSSSGTPVNCPMCRKRSTRNLTFPIIAKIKR